jgi:hypothetical protein
VIHAGGIEKAGCEIAENLCTVAFGTHFFIGWQALRRTLKEQGDCRRVALTGFGLALPGIVPAASSADESSRIHLSSAVICLSRPAERLVRPPGIGD